MARCEWNPVLQVGATDPASPGDCPNEGTVCVGANGRWHVCESCASLPAFARFKRSPIRTVEEEVTRRMSLSFEDSLREDLERAKEACPPGSLGFGAANAQVILEVFGLLIDDPRAKPALIRAYKRLT